MVFPAESVSFISSPTLLMTLTAQEMIDVLYLHDDPDGHFSSWATTAEATFQTKCFSGATSEKITFCQKWKLQQRKRKCPLAPPPQQHHSEDTTFPPAIIKTPVWGLFVPLEWLNERWACWLKTANRRCLLPINYLSGFFSSLGNTKFYYNSYLLLTLLNDHQLWEMFKLSTGINVLISVWAFCLDAEAVFILLCASPLIECDFVGHNESGLGHKGESTEPNPDPVFCWSSKMAHWTNPVMYLDKNLVKNAWKWEKQRLFFKK